MTKNAKPQPSVIPSEVEGSFLKEINSLKEQMASIDDKFKRALADYQNLERNQHQSKLIEKGKIIAKFLPLLDGLELTHQHTKDPVIGMMVKEFRKVLNELSVNVINSDKGSPFNSLTMDCVEVVPGDKDKVVNTVQSGYRLDEIILRPARVEVGSGIDDRNSKPASGEPAESIEGPSNR